MFNIMVGMEYALPQAPKQADIPAVASVLPRKELKRNRDRKKEDPRNKRKQGFKDLLEKEAAEELGQMGCFFETTV